jgi:hypothetical protein
MDTAPDAGVDGASEVSSTSDVGSSDDVPLHVQADGAPDDVPADTGGTSDVGTGNPPDGGADGKSDLSSDLSSDVTSDLSSDHAPEAGGGPDGASDAGNGLACAGATVTGSHVIFDFDTKNAEWVRALKWRDSTGTLTGNLNVSGGALGCSTPAEFFGQAFMAPEPDGNTPFPIGANTLASVTGCGTVDQTIVSQSPDCTNTAQVPTTTVYHFYSGTKADQVRVSRTIGFGASNGPLTGTGMRVYVPRVPRDSFTTILIPNGASTAVTTKSVYGCGVDCFTTKGASWNGQWFADVNPANGLAMIVLRDPSITTDAEMTINNDLDSASNLSSFVVLQPAGGWKAPLVETEYLCFADLTSWPQASRDAATLPAFCGP